MPRMPNTHAMIPPMMTIKNIIFFKMYLKSHKSRFHNILLNIQNKSMIFKKCFCLVYIHILSYALCAVMFLCAGSAESHHKMHGQLFVIILCSLSIYNNSIPKYPIHELTNALTFQTLYLCIAVL